MHKVDWAIEISPMLGSMNECGDLPLVIIRQDFCYIFLADVLGHGSEAREIAVQIEEYICRYYELSPNKMIENLNSLINGTRGAVIAACRLNLSSGLLEYSGVGNITLKVFGIVKDSLIINDGIVGYSFTTPRLKRLNLNPGDIILMNTDGLREHFEFLEYEDILCGNVEVIAKKMMSRRNKGNDDAAIIIAKYI